MAAAVVARIGEFDELLVMARKKTYVKGTHWALVFLLGDVTVRAM